MFGTGIEAFDSTLHKTNIWFKELMEEMDFQDRHQAYLALRAVLHALRDRLSVEEAAQLGAQLPLLIRGFYYEGWMPSGKPTKERHKEQFLAKIADYFTKDPELDPERVVRAVFHLLERHISSGEIADIKHTFPKELLELWEPRGTA